jgi:O-antigen ligase
MKRPFLGYGLGAFWQGLNGESGDVAISLGWTGIGYAENGLLELWLQLGAVGTIVYVAIFIGAVRDAVFCLSRKASAEVMWYCSVLFYIVISNLEGGKLLTPTDLGCVIPLAIYVALRREAARIKMATMEKPESGIRLNPSLEKAA